MSPQKDARTYKKNQIRLRKSEKRNSASLIMLSKAHQKNIRSVLATKRVKQTYKEKPSAFPVFHISEYCGMYGMMPPKIINAEAA